MELFDGYQASRDEVIAAGWTKMDEGCLAGKAHWHWETWVSPDDELIITFYNGHETSSICRNV